jgi:dTDP-4-dehydrorhamnose 3,5-epimerase
MNSTPPPERRARQTVTHDWNPIEPVGIHDVQIQEVKNVIYSRGVLTEIYRQEWFKDHFTVRHVTLVHLLPGETSQWHRHHEQKDIIFPVGGFIRIGIYDGRVDSVSFGKSIVQTFNPSRPRFVYVPPGIWHSLRNIGPEQASYIVLNDTEYNYENPDDWVLPPNSTAIPVKLD